MTLAELNAHFDLLMQRVQAQEILNSLYDKARPGSPPLTGMPRGTDVTDKVGNLALEIAEFKEQVDELDTRIAESSIKVEMFVKGISNLRMRLIFRLRFIRGQSWKEVADAIGASISESTAKQLCYNYLRTHEHDLTCR